MARLSSVDQMRANVPQITLAVMPIVDVEARIDEADKLIENKLSKIVDFSLVVYADGTTTPEFVNLLSQYKSAELCLVAKYGAKRRVDEQSDITYWAKAYMELLTEIQEGDIDLGVVAVGSPDFQNNVRKDVPPAVGMGEQGGFIDEDALEAQRKDLGND